MSSEWWPPVNKGHYFWVPRLFVVRWYWCFSCFTLSFIFYHLNVLRKRNVEKNLIILIGRRKDKIISDILTSFLGRGKEREKIEIFLLLIKNSNYFGKFFWRWRYFYDEWNIFWFTDLFFMFKTLIWTFSLKKKLILDYINNLKNTP
jgi:hypothetical protein